MEPIDTSSAARHVDLNIAAGNVDYHHLTSPTNAGQRRAGQRIRFRKPGNEQVQKQLDILESCINQHLQRHSKGGGSTRTTLTENSSATSTTISDENGTTPRPSLTRQESSKNLRKWVVFKRGEFPITYGAKGQNSVARVSVFVSEKEVGAKEESSIRRELLKFKEKLKRKHKHKITSQHLKKNAKEKDFTTHPDEAIALVIDKKTGTIKVYSLSGPDDHLSVLDEHEFHIDYHKLELEQMREEEALDIHNLKENNNPLANRRRFVKTRSRNKVPITIQSKRVKPDLEAQKLRTRLSRFDKIKKKEEEKKETHLKIKREYIKKDALKFDQDKQDILNTQCKRKIRNRRPLHDIEN